MANENGKAYGLTVLFPIKKGSDGTLSYTEKLRTFLAAMPNGEESPFARVPATHFSRFVVIDKLAYNGEPSLPDDLISAYLLWTACFNGKLEPWLEIIWEHMQSEVQTILEHCVVYSEYTGFSGFSNYVKKCQVTTSFLFADYPDATLEEILEGLKLKKHFVDFVAENQGASAVDLKANFAEWMRTMDATPSPKSGEVY